LGKKKIKVMKNMKELLVSSQETRQRETNKKVFALWKRL
jgi:hypothetical protein